MLDRIESRLSSYNDTALLIGRVLIGALFVISAYNKVRGYGGSVGYFTKLGLPLPSLLVPLTIVFEAAAGVFMIIGYRTRITALAIAAFCVLSALVAHLNLADGNQLNHFLKNMAIAGGCLAILVAGAGRQSVDKR